MAEGNRTGGGEGLSLQTLVVAAAASGLAAIVVSHLWKGGTVIAAAMTPVIVAITRELITRPMESEIVRKPVQQVGRLSCSPRPAAPGRAGGGGARGGGGGGGGRGGRGGAGGRACRPGRGGPRAPPPGARPPPRRTPANRPRRSAP